MSTRLAAFVLAAALAAPALASAQPAQPGGGQPMPGHGGARGAMQARFCADLDARLASRLAWIEAKVKPTEAQRGAWEGFVRDSRAAAEPLRARCAAPAAAPAAGDLAAELARREGRMAMMLDVTRQTRAAVEKLLPALGEEQRKALAENFHGPRGMHHGGHRMHRDHHGHHGHHESREHREHRGRPMQPMQDGQGMRQGG
jgi:hypothetical protein